MATMSSTGEPDGARPPRPVEMRVLEQLLAAAFPGQAELQQQATTLRVREIDRCGCLELHVAPGRPAPVVRRIPVEAETMDADGVVIHVLLHVVDGYLDELEVFREDGELPTTSIDAGSLRVLVF